LRGAYAGSIVEIRLVLDRNIAVRGFAVSAIYSQRASILQAGRNLVSALAVPSSVTPPTQIPQQSSAAADVNTAGHFGDSPPFPLPSDYGVYALANAELSELQFLSEQVPDKRVAISTPINQPSRTILPDGNPKFRGGTPAISRAAHLIELKFAWSPGWRALTFDSKGKPNWSPVDTWNIRSLSYEFKAWPIAANPEMLLVQPRDADFTLPAGRYILALKNQGYDFTVAGKVTDHRSVLSGHMPPTDPSTRIVKNNRGFFYTGNTFADRMSEDRSHALQP
jgi:hypothetical protein